LSIRSILPNITSFNTSSLDACISTAILNYRISSSLCSKDLYLNIVLFPLIKDGQYMAVLAQIRQLRGVMQYFLYYHLSLSGSLLLNGFISLTQKPMKRTFSSSLNLSLCIHLQQKGIFQEQA
jgi:hypothetical protein